MSNSTTTDKQSNTNTKQTADRILCALRDVLNAGLDHYDPDHKFIVRHSKYVKDIKSAQHKNAKAKAIAKHLVPNEEAYNKKCSEYPGFYKDKGKVLESLLNFLEVCREISLKSSQRTLNKKEKDDFLKNIFGE